MTRRQLYILKNYLRATLEVHEMFESANWDAEIKNAIDLTIGASMVLSDTLRDYKNYLKRKEREIEWRRKNDI